jgi:hypothetical protein
MSEVLKPGDGFVYMKVGTHARETLEDIIKRKTKEIEDAGFALWGYGGNTCHPQTMIQPFVGVYEKRSGPIYLYMEPMDSKHFAEPLRADEFSMDGVNWSEIPKPINVLGSRYALVLKDLHSVQMDIHLADTRVALGRSAGTAGSDYVKGRVDKACLELIEPVQSSEDRRPVSIRLAAELQAPYAVYVRNRSD